MTQSTDAFDRDVRRFVYDVVLRRGYPPTTAEAAAGLRATVDEVRGCFARLAAGHILVLQSGAGEILMANPFSAVPTPFLVEFDDYACSGNCIWEARGIAAGRCRRACIETSCGHCGGLVVVGVGAG